ncbi:3'(2'),5'-bisphosphate nucleotidase CysQ [Teichococcus vastitatis]|uniref:3'(2'),5'-bisphosphate nucleotidase CysQ n=1 Tax=Teichococcus vastitatis TaxID=2307076 RepID=A0ABS9W6K6_9PROT|nr:3'(2'),5'-bisphosphate nucleotidase CysQ [Pseudoroseomonas vastitatis]MCI0754673.1 3'(2'),5'-bisphosphate nucleotidase CysQ [Pseudoroseomonas vastitatis]
MTDAELLALAARLAQSAAAAILSVRDAGFAVERKDDMSPVTAADRLAEAIIAEGLRAAAPGIPVVAEEECSVSEVTTDAERYWLVDPLDGTREFAAGRAEFTVNIGLVDRGRPVLGAVAIPAYGELFTGIIGVGAWKRNADGTERPIAARRVPAEGLTVMASRHYGDDPRLTEFLGEQKVAEIVKIGSAVKFCRLAEGVGDVYPRFGRTMEWDTAAPEAVLLAAGGRCTTFDGAPLGYGKPLWENPPFLCRGAA